MIVQTAAPNAPHFVITQADHALASADLAAAFGNGQFAPLEPAGPLHFTTAHHDDGWIDLDAQWLQDPNTGLPYHLVKTPLDKLVRTGKGSPDVNEAHHPLCGIISSMHTYGLYHGRYGLSNFIFIDIMPAELQPYVSDMLANELVRQERLKQAIPAEWNNEVFLFHQYKLLQFFDTLSLYFQTTHAEGRTTAEFANVPRAVGDDITLSLTPLENGSYQLAPWPFKEAELTLSTTGRFMTPQPAGTDLAPIANTTATTIQHAHLVAQ